MGAYGSPELNNMQNDTQTHNQNMVNCSYCGFCFSKKLGKCPRCGKKTTETILSWWIIGILVIIVIFALKSSYGNTNTATDNTNERSSDVIEQVEILEDEYKAQCSSIPYSDIARNPNDYIGQKTVYTGKVIQVQENGRNVVLRFNVTQGDYGLWDDTIYVNYYTKSDNESRILEDDIVTVYGEFIGIKTYVAVLGNSVSIPHIKAEYIDVN